MPEKKVKVGLIQPNLNPWDKWSSGDIKSILNLDLDLSDKAINEGARLIIWPETALPVYLLGGTYSSIVDSIYSFIRQRNVYLLTGMPDIIHHYQDTPDDAKYNESGDYYYSTYNAVLLFSPNTTDVQRYGKMKLVPFGEKVPYADSDLSFFRVK
jgi:apolipoprotein N-acyltransferase